MTTAQYFGYTPNQFQAMQAIRQGHANEYTYKDQIFTIEVKPFKMIISWNGHTAETPTQYNYIDLLGIAACLLKYKKDLIFDKEGNLI